MQTLSAIPLDRIEPSGSSTQKSRRRRFDKGKLDELADSVSQLGVLQPIILRPLGENGTSRYEIVAGERRYLAAQKAGLDEIPAIVRELADDAVLEVQLIENLQRADLHPMEEAEGYAELVKHGHDVDELHSRVGKSKSYVYQRLKLLDLCKPLRKAYFEGSFGASIALLLARIPSDKLQREALKSITDWDKRVTSVARAREVVERKYMLRLRGAPFPVKDADLPGGACAACPKRTGNQAEIFSDVKSRDMCTDPVCFWKKAKTHGSRQIKSARAAGVPVLTAKEAKEIMPYEDDHVVGSKFVLANRKMWEDTKQRTARSILGKDAEITLAQHPKTGQVVKLVSRSAVLKKIQKSVSGSKGRATTVDKQRQEAKQERAFRRELLAALRPGLVAPTMSDIAKAMINRMDHETKRALCAARGFEPPKVDSMGRAHRNYGAVVGIVDDMTEDEASVFVRELLLVPDLIVWAYSDRKPERLLAEADRQGIDVEALRKSTQATKPRKTTKKK